MSNVLTRLNSKRALLTLSLACLPLITSAHSYPELSKTRKAGAYTGAIERDHVYRVNDEVRHLLYGYYRDMTFNNPNEDKYRILDDFTFYDSVRAFSGEICAMIWRHANRMPERYREGNIEAEPILNTTKLEQTPFFAPASPWYSQDYAITYRGDLNAYRHFVSAGNKYDEYHIGYPLHRVGTLFGQYAQGKKEYMVVSLQTDFLGVVDGNISREKLLSSDKALLTMVMLPFSYNDIASMIVERKAYLSCKVMAKFIIPHR
ncbi:hypothetical protein ACNUDM_08400 [Vibrio chaetopteri]|uniref:hypothetical protein n=1 Tax=Vibrio chaetopteri TaxID=3016528 RepID=UPI003AB2C3F0